MAPIKQANEVVSFGLFNTQDVGTATAFAYLSSQTVEGGSAAFAFRHEVNAVPQHSSTRCFESTSCSLAQGRVFGR